MPNSRFWRVRLSRHFCVRLCVNARSGVCSIRQLSESRQEAGNARSASWTVCRSMRTSEAVRSASCARAREAVRRSVRRTVSSLRASILLRGASAELLHSSYSRRRAGASDRHQRPFSRCVKFVYACPTRPLTTAERRARHVIVVASRVQDHLPQI